MFEPFTPSFFRRLQQLKIRTRRSYLGSRQGSHLSKRRGHGLEFAEFRPYTPGDDFRHIDWSVYGRTDRLYVKEFREEQDLNVSIMIDASASMAFPEAQSKYVLACQLAVALGHVALTDGDTVTLSLLGSETSPRYIGPRALAKARTFLSSHHPAGAINFPAEVRRALSRLRIPGKCFLISDFLLPLPEQFAAFDYLRAKNFDISLLQILSPQELALDTALNDYVVVDAESGAEVELQLGERSKADYAALLADHVAQLEQYCRRADIVHLLLSSADDLAGVVLTRLPALGLLS